MGVSVDKVWDFRGLQRIGQVVEIKDVSWSGGRNESFVSCTCLICVETKWISNFGFLVTRCYWFITAFVLVFQMTTSVVTQKESVERSSRINEGRE